MRLPAVDTRTEGEREEKRRERERGAGSRRARRFPSYLCGPLFAGTAPIYSDYQYVFAQVSGPALHKYLCNHETPPR